MPRFFLKTPIELGDTVELVGEDAHHISYSLRMAVGEEITVTDSRDWDTPAVLLLLTAPV